MVYSGGMPGYLPALCSVITVSAEANTTSLSNPVKIMVPASWASGRSMDCRNEMAGKERMALSSLMVPLSEMVHLACICKFIQSKEPNGCKSHFIVYLKKIFCVLF